MSISSRIWNVADFALNLALCIIFIINSTYVDKNKTPARIPESNRLIELVLALVFLGQYSAKYAFLSRTYWKLEHVVVFFTSVSPVAAFIISTGSEFVRNSYMSAGTMVIFYPIRFLRLFYAFKRLLAIVAASKKYIRLSLIRKEVVSLAGDILISILFFASLVHSGLNWFSQFKKSQSPSFTFLDAIYFIVSK
ncbi:hypothetical protein GGF37_003873 [Kickxella alabastrina]|nr:hypothetical protein GGF37_003873 [Kickxella alabastrina]